MTKPSEDVTMKEQIERILQHNFEPEMSYISGKVGRVSDALEALFQQRLEERGKEFYQLINDWAEEGTDAEREVVPGLLNYLEKISEAGSE